MSDRGEPSDTAGLEKDAYRRAWKTRQATGNDSSDVLLAEWALIGYAPDKVERELWLRAWTTSVPPRRLGRYVLKWTGREAIAIVKELRGILDDPELPDWLMPPPQFRMLSVGFVGGDVKKRTVPFTPDPEPSPVLDRMLGLREKKDGYRKVRVWLHPSADASRVAVMAGVARVGWTSLDQQQLRKLRPKPWSRRIKVSDGNLKFMLSPSGEITSGKLRMHLPPAS